MRDNKPLVHPQPAVIMAHPAANDKRIVGSPQVIVAALREKEPRRLGVGAPASWTAAALCRFSLARKKPHFRPPKLSEPLHRPTRQRQRASLPPGAFPFSAPRTSAVP